MSSKPGRRPSGQAAHGASAAAGPAPDQQPAPGQRSAPGQKPAPGRKSAPQQASPAAGHGSAAPSRAATVVTVAACISLFLLGLLEGLIGSFQYSRGPVPLLAVVFAVAIFATCTLGARGMRSALGGVLPALGWFLVTLYLSNGTASGSVVITDSTVGKWFLFGGALAAAAGAVTGFARWSKASRDRRESQNRTPR